MGFLLGAVLVLAVPVCDPDDPTKCSAPLVQGSAAPFAGQLLTPALAIDLGLKAQFCDARIALEVGHAKATVQADLDLERRLRQVDVAAADEAQAVLMRRFANASPWYERPWFVAGVATVGTVAAFTLAMKSVDWVKVGK